MEIQSYQKKEIMRDHSIDIAKGIAIILVLLGHISITPKGLTIWLYSFHIPLFFLCSGMVLSIEKNPSIWLFFKKKAKSLIWPYFTLGISLWLLQNIFLIIHNSTFETKEVVDWNICHILLKLLLGYRLHYHYYTLWFVCVLFVGELITYVFLRYIYKGPTHAIPVIGIGLIFIQWVVFKGIKGFFWSLDLLPCGIAFLLIGYYLRIVKKELSRIAVWYVILALLAINIMIGAINYKAHGMVNLYSCEMGYPHWFALSAVAGSICVILICKRLKTSPVLEYFGRNSLIIYAYNNNLTIPIAKDLVSAATSTSDLLKEESFQWVLVTVIACSLSCVLVEVITRYFPFVIAKRSVPNE